MTIMSQSPSNPYVGPRAFQRDEILYGRDHEIKELLNLLIAERIVLLHSPSGAGKTSLIQAALIPELDKQEFQVLPVMRVSLIPPPDLGLPRGTNRYVLSLLLSLEEALPAGQRTSPTQLACMELVDYLRQWLQVTGKPITTTVLIFDQFEEILTIDPIDLEAKAAFFAQVGAALLNRNWWALFAMREEYLPSLDPYLHLIPTRFNTTFRLDLLRKETARQAMRGPTRQVGVEFLDDAVEKLVDDLRKIQVQGPDGTTHKRLGPYVEPVQLQVVCHRLWEYPRLDKSKITLDDVLHFGDVDQALAMFYENAVHAAAMAAGVVESQIREWCEQKLITPLQTRGLVLREHHTTGGLPNIAVDELERQHLIRAEERAGARWYELTHDRFIEPIQKSNQPQELKPTKKTFSEEEMNKWLEGTAYYLSRHRRLRKFFNDPIDKILQSYQSSSEEWKVDEYNSKLLFTCQILDGNINFAYQNIPEIYLLLESIWLTEVKQFKAYFIWEKRGGSWDSEYQKSDYYEASEQIRHALENPNIKAHRKDFGEARAYLERYYLTDGKIDKNKPATKEMIHLKSHRIQEITGETDFRKNQLQTEEYVQMFYENIIPAVIKDDPEKVLMTLKAFQFSEEPEHQYSIINCFETALAIYFLNSDIIREVWERSGKTAPESFTVNIRIGDTWPDDFFIPQECKDKFKFDRENGQIIFKGAMTWLQKESLLARLTKEENKDAIKSLFEQSRLLLREITL